MKYIVNSQEMKAIDSYSIQKIGIPSLVLMERAALSVVDVMRDGINREDRILIISGTGNNGGDGIAVGRILHQLGYYVDILITGDQNTATKEFKEQLAIAYNIGIDIFNQHSKMEYNIIVDAIFGIGLSKDVTGIYKDIIEWVNESSAKVYSIDIPSGIHADTGKVMNVAIKADETITFGFYKIGIIMHPGAEYAGKVTLSDIGFPDQAREAVAPKYYIYEDEDRKRLPIREKYSNKGTFGKVLAITGSRDIVGASFLTAKAAYRMGAGIVKILTVRENREILHMLLPEALVSTYESEELKQEEYIQNIIDEIHSATSIIIGPGIGTGKDARLILSLVLKHSRVPTVIDADAINILAMDKQYNYMNLPGNYILTPHLKEMSRLMECDVDSISEDILKTVQSTTIKGGYALVLKDTRTIVSNGLLHYINVTGNNGMATGGSGDVLTGIIGGLLAQGMKPYEAATLGVYLHGLAGDKAASQKGLYSMIASDIIEALPEVVTI